MSKKIIRYAVLGLGHIAQAAVLPAFKNCKSSKLAALISGDPEKRKLLAKKYKISETCSYDDLERCLKINEIDAVYIALPNHLHKEYTLRAAQAGVHVLCEKPMAVSTQDCEEMIQVCDEHDVKLMVAYRLHFEAANLAAVDLVRRKKIGEARLFHSIHSQPVKPGNIRTLPIALGGGPTYDVGIYDINAARYIFQDEPLSLCAQMARSKDPALKDIEEAMSISMKFPGERLASILCSFGAVYADTFRVMGTKGELSIEPAYTYKGKKRVRYTEKGRSKQLLIQRRDQFSPEIDYFSGCIVKNRMPEPSGLEGLADIRIIEAIQHSVQTGETVSLPPLQKEQRPGLDQEIGRPAVQPPKPFRVSSPSKKVA